jgi:uncharacterized protein YueI
MSPDIGYILSMEQSVNPKKKKRMMITLLVNEEEREALRWIVEEENVSQSQFIRTAIRLSAKEIAQKLYLQGRKVPKQLRPFYALFSSTALSSDIYNEQQSANKPK